MILVAALWACDDMEDKNQSTTSATQANDLIVLCEGLFNMNNSSLFAISNSNVTNDSFEAVNGRKIGDTANSMIVYGGKIYIAVDVSGTIEVVDRQTLKSLAQIEMKITNGTSREPRCLASYDKYVYVCNYDGTLSRIDTAALAIDAEVEVGRNPDGICAAGGKIFVSNSGGLSAPNYDTSVSVVDARSMTVQTIIEVGQNPGRMALTPLGIVVLVRGDYEQVEPFLAIIDAENLNVSRRIDLPATNFCATNDGIFCYTYSYVAKAAEYYTISSNGAIELWTPEIQPQTPYCLAFNAKNGDVLIADAKDYTVSGDVHCFGADGKHKYTINNVGLNPNTIIITQTAVNENGNSEADAFIQPAEVVCYTPAPGQFVNTVTSCYADGYTYEDVLSEALKRLRSGSPITLGGWGGRIEVRFDEPIVRAEGAELHIVGNAFAGSAEPGIVCVSKDGKEWFELVGSAAERAHNYSITYKNGSPITWTDSNGNFGTVEQNEYHTQPYFPLWLGDELQFSGKLLPDVGAFDDAQKRWVFTPFEWGYVDNLSEADGGAEFDLDNAIDADGNHVDIDSVTYVAVYTAVMQTCGSLGEVSTEITKIEAVRQ
ncbi:MAG: YncE family protein [Bacteroidales bacterium]|nr:YncE family protein [Bacteroidales bacterium]